MNDSLIVVFNAGSSSLKFEVFGADGELRTLARGSVRDIARAEAGFDHDGRHEALGHVPDARAAAQIVLERLFIAPSAPFRRERVRATGHRVVHGGEHFVAPVRITVSAFDRLKSLVHLAPLHNPHSLAVMEAVGEHFPDLPIVAVFDTAFFHELPDSARCYALPREWTERHALRRYGFHGIAHEYLSRRLHASGAPSRAVALHLGQGCSAAALLDGRPVDTSMGFSPLEGLVMGTRCGDVDPGLILHLAHLGESWKSIEDGLNRRSGLLGVSGASDDVRELLALEGQGHAGAARALDVFVTRIRKYVGAYAAVLGGVDAIAFGGGIGENSPEIRARVLEGMRWLGVELDPLANAACIGTGAQISAPSSRVAVHVFPVDEEPIIAESVLRVVEQA